MEGVEVENFRESGEEGARDAVNNQEGKEVGARTGRITQKESLNKEGRERYKKKEEEKKRLNLINAKNVVGTQTKRTDGKSRGIKG